MLALIAGQGRLPELLADTLDAGSAPWLLCAMEGAPCTVPDAGRECRSFRIERLGTFLQDLRREGATEVCFAGAVRRPDIDPTAIDAATAPLVPRLSQAMKDGDDTTLRTVLALFEEAGLTPRAAHELRPDLLVEPGCLTRAEPSVRDRADIDRAARIVGALGAADVGQSCVVAQGQALAVEALPGTDRMLATLPGLADIRPDPAAGRGILYKAPKPGQDHRVDLPTIGPDTVAGALRAGLSGLAVEAGGVLVLDRDRVCADCDAAGLFLWGHVP
ncbi:hypothetical protein SAMN04490244_101128 [Tranquillimonas rosea]|uniref:Phosphatidate cytidylyltransferase n=1 Tax=Tranquillimonas rosea TaxID=641238 RepID=A0A1H9PER8_9RHOB|nr:UDP-2,3-diacylglucosamine diphosphatase LpxI [Tranquillimonas rosea]SER46083.1 hypothetical protein SAMN04490244_101128 [Tranquillimonas rosea]